MVDKSFSRESAFFCWVVFSSLTAPAWPVSPFTTAAKEAPEETTEEEEEGAPDFALAWPGEGWGVLVLWAFPWGSLCPQERHTWRVVQL